MTIASNTITRLLTGLLIIGTLTAPLPASARAVSQVGEEVTTDPGGDATGSGLSAVGDSLELTLEEAIAIALQRNLTLAVERYERAQFELRIDQNLGIYDLTIGGFAFSNEETSPSASEIDGADILTREQEDLNIGLDQLTPWGGTASTTFNVFRQEDNSIFSTLNPFYFTELDVSVSQPLLRNFGRLSTERGIAVAKLDSAISGERFEDQVVTTIQEVVNAFYTLTENREQLVVAREGLELAEELHEMNRVRVDVGTLAPLELIQSEAGIATRREEIIRARAAVEDAEDELRRLLNLEDGPLWDVAIVPQTEPDVTRVDLDLEAALESAFEERTEISQQEIEIETLRIEAAYRKSQLLPRLDLTATYGYNGIGGDVLLEPGNPNSPVEEGGFGDAIDQLESGDFDGWEIRLDFGIPLQNRDARARRAIAELDLEQGNVELQRLRQDIRTEVRRSVRAVETAMEQIESARASLHLEEKNLDAEQKRYENGLSTSFQVLEIQEDLTAAKSREVSAIASYRRALTDYYRAIGGLLEASGVDVVDTVADGASRRFSFSM